MSDEQHHKVICHDCMRPVAVNRAKGKLVHTGHGMEEWVFCPRCAAHRGIPGGPGGRGPKTI